ncbi:MAG: zinc ribbon domain-containing protein [Clostridiales bacterium]|jgi:hypothetical protein|nr:zinc ribbon domain-containing protein [Clostridiales bacterium]
MICSNCSKQLSDITAACPYCGYSAAEPHPGRDGAKDALSMLNARIERNKLRREALPQDERILKIISDFEIRTDVVFKPAQMPRVYQARQTYNPEPLYTSAKVSLPVIILNILLTLIFPPAGLIRAIVILAKKDSRLKDLGVVTLALSIILILSELLLIWVNWL